MNEAKEGQQPTGEQAVFRAYSKQWLAWLDYHQVTGNHARAELMRHQAENGRSNEWAEPTPYHRRTQGRFKWSSQRLMRSYDDQMEAAIGSFG
jgi:hypothetical protein